MVVLPVGVACPSRPHPLAPSPAPSLPPSPGEGERFVKVSQEPGEDQVQKKVLEIVAKQTGYPLEMLALDLDMEADLGIDTVKEHPPG